MKNSALIAFIAAGIFLAGCTKPEYNFPEGERPYKGSLSAAVTVEEFGDFQCPACGASYPLAKSLKDTYGDAILFKFRHFPLRHIHAFAQKSAEAAECANDQKKFWEMHDKMFENQSQLDRGSLGKY